MIAFAFGFLFFVTSLAVDVITLQPYLSQQATLQASINGVTGTFLFDTGEGVSAITPDFAKRIGCRPWGKITGFRMTGERGGNEHCDDLKVLAGGLTLNVPAAITLDVTKLIGPGVPPVDGAIGLDAFAGLALTVVPRSCIVVETSESLKHRVAGVSPLPIHIVRDAEGAALTVDGAVPTPDGTAWMELDTGNGGSTVVANYIAPLLDIPTDISTPQQYSFKLANGIAVNGPVRTRDLIMDGNIGARFLNQWNLSIDLAKATAWLTPLSPCR